MYSWQVRGDSGPRRNLKYLQQKCRGTTNDEFLRAENIHLAGKHTMGLFQRSKFVITLLAFFFLRVQADESMGMCCLCEDCDFPVTGREYIPVDEFGTTCYDKILEMADGGNESTQGSDKCKSLQNQYRQTCCDANYTPIEVAQAPTSAPVINLPSNGAEPICNVCPDGGFPDLPKTVLAILYIPGNPTCEILYEMGLQKLIPQRVCNPIQDYLYEACGCNRIVSNLAPVLADLSATAQAPTSSVPSSAPSPTPSLEAKKKYVTGASVSKSTESAFVLGEVGEGRLRGGTRRRQLKGTGGVV
jgi:hypothetical protein